jgi:chromosomal replication initiation ATPase DnaA
MSSVELLDFAAFMKGRGYDISDDIAKFYISLNPEKYEDLIMATVSDVTNIPISQMKSKSRKREIVYARAICCKMLKEYTSLSLNSIGLILGGRDHSTVIHALETHENIVWQDYEFKLQSEKCNNIINTVYLQRELKMCIQKGEGLNNQLNNLQNTGE